MSRSRHWAGLLCIVALGAAACGTTVPQTTTLGSSAGAGSVAGTGVSGDATLGAGPSTVSGTGSTSAGSIGSAAGVAATGAAVAATGAAATSGVTAAGQAAPGVASTPGATATAAAGTKTTAKGSTTTTGGPTKGKSAAPTKSATTAPAPAAKAASAASPVMIGFATETDVTAYASTLGISGVDGGDTEAQLQAVVADVNAHGGLAGHKVIIDEYPINTTERASNASSVAAAACAHWTQDNHDFAVVDSYAGISDLPGMLTCLQAANVPLISDFPTDDADDSDYSSDPLFASPSSMTVDAYIPAEIDRLYADGFFSGWNTNTGTASPSTPPVLGAESFDDAPGKHYIAVLTAALAKHGLSLKVVDSHDRNAEASATAASAAVLNFRSAGVTHVFFANIVFYEQANSQGYKPRYNVDDLIGPELLAENVGASQLNGAMGSGYQPYNEATAATAPNSSTTQCLAMMAAAGQVPATELATESMITLCSHWYLLQQIFAHQTALTPATFTAGLNALGTSFGDAATYAASFGPNRHYGANQLRDYAYDSGCTCFKFTSTQTYPVS